MEGELLPNSKAFLHSLLSTMGEGMLARSLEGCCLLMGAAFQPLARKCTLVKGPGWERRPPSHGHSDGFGLH